MLFEPLIPYVQVPELVLLPARALGDFPASRLSIKPFGALVASAVYIGSYLAIRQGKRLGLDERRLLSLIFWSIGIGLVSAHVLDVVFYYPRSLIDDPLRVLRLWEGLSSFGGFCGGIAGALLWRWRFKARLLPYAEMIVSAFPVSWVLGRTGCAIVHDHPGMRSEAWFAVAYPGGGRLDLGLYEMLLTMPIAIVFLILRRRPRPLGLYAGLASVAYAPTRFALDFLRAKDVAIADARYAGYTPAQWACFGLLAFGLVMLHRALGAGLIPATGALPAPGVHAAAVGPASLHPYRSEPAPHGGGAQPR